MFEVPNPLYEQIIKLLLPLMDTVANRQAQVSLAFQDVPALYNQITWEGDAQTFTIALVDLCITYGTLASEEEALVVLLTSVHSSLGHDGQTKIDDLLRQLGMPPTPPDLMPYRGLQPFRVEDAPFYFGREDVVKGLIKTVNDNSFVVVVGDSGSGKSSLIRAGLVAQLQAGILPDSQKWQFALIRPRTDPLRELADALIQRIDPNLSRAKRLLMARDYATRLLDQKLTIQHDIVPELQKQLPAVPHFLLIIDQFEEIFDPIVDERSRQALVSSLIGADQTGWVKIILVLRADFYNFMLKYRELVERANQATFNIPPMNEAERKAAIEKPVQKADRRFEAGLVERIIQDVKDAAADLPLLQFALTELWKRQTGDGVLTHVAYDAIGGVPGAIARHAQRVYQKLNAFEKDQTRVLFTRRLVKVPEPEKAIKESTRRHINLGDLDETTQQLITQTLAGEGLLVTGRDEATGERTVEIVHESLIQHWNQLLDWLTQDQVNLRIHQALIEAVEIWERFKRKPAMLYRGEHLRQAQNWAKGQSKELIPKEQNFLDISQRWVWYRWSAAGGGVLLFILLFGLLFFLPPTSQIPSGPVPTPTVKIPMPAGFNIAVARFKIDNYESIDDELIQDDLDEASETFPQQIATFFAENRARLPADLREGYVVGPDRFDLEAHGEDSLREKSKELNAKVLIYGNLAKKSSISWDIELHFYISDFVLTERMPQFVNEETLGRPISYRIGHSDEPTQELQKRLELLIYIISGLTYYNLASTDSYQQASAIFCDTAQDAVESGLNEGAEVLYLYCAQTKIGLSWLLREGSQRDSQLLDEGLQAYQKALDVNPDYLKAQVNRAAVLVDLYAHGSYSRCDLNEKTKNLLKEAQETLEKALDNFEVRENPSYRMQFVLHVNLGNIYFRYGLCDYYEENFVGMENYWNQAKTQYELAIAEELRNNVRKDIADRSAVRAYAQTSILFTISYELFQQVSAIDQAETFLKEATRNAEEAILLLIEYKDVERELDYGIRVIAHLLTPLCESDRNENAQSYYSQFTEDLPDTIKEQILSKINLDIREECRL